MLLGINLLLSHPSPPNRIALKQLLSLPFPASTRGKKKKKKLILTVLKIPE